MRDQAGEDAFQEAVGSECVTHGSAWAVRKKRETDVGRGAENWAMVREARKPAPRVERGVRPGSGDGGHEKAGPQVRSSQWSDPSGVGELTRLALAVGETEIKGSETIQDLWLELPFTKLGLRAGLCAPVGLEVGSLVLRMLDCPCPANLSWELNIEIGEVSPRSLTNPQRLLEEAGTKDNFRDEVREALAWPSLKL